MEELQTSPPLRAASGLPERVLSRPGSAARKSAQGPPSTPRSAFGDATNLQSHSSNGVGRRESPSPLRTARTPPSRSPGPASIRGAGGLERRGGSASAGNPVWRPPSAHPQPIAVAAVQRESPQPRLLFRNSPPPGSAHRCDVFFPSCNVLSLYSAGFTPKDMDTVNFCGVLKLKPLFPAISIAYRMIRAGLGVLRYLAINSLSKS